MTEHVDDACKNELIRNLMEEVEEKIDERLQVEALAQIVEQTAQSESLNTRLRAVFQDIDRKSQRMYREKELMLAEVRNLLLDVALLKRALVSIGQTGVLKKAELERELILEVFPPQGVAKVRAFASETATANPKQLLTAKGGWTFVERHAVERDAFR